MITFLVSVDDDGSVIINKLADPVVGGNVMGLVATLADKGFETGVIRDGERIDLHVKLSERVKRDVIITVLDDTVPAFTNAADAEAWMAARQSGPMARYG